jgi:predicted DNA-binding transcriptional regulator AlpA
MNYPTFPEKGFVRLWQIIGDPKADPPCPAVIPVSKSTWWQGVKTGRFPQPVKLGPRTTAWRVEDILALIENPDSWQKPGKI